MKEVRYPTINEIIEINKNILQEIKVRKADRSALIFSGKKTLEDIIKDMKNKKGDLFDKAVVLLKGIIKNHPFESGNRRTALVATASFLGVNNEKLNITHDINIFQGIRESYYAGDEIKNWLKGGEIRAFKR